MVVVAVPVVAGTDDGELVSAAHGDARAILAADPALSRPACAGLAAELKAVFGNPPQDYSRGA